MRRSWSLHVLRQERQARTRPCADCKAAPGEFCTSVARDGLTPVRRLRVHVSRLAPEQPRPAASLARPRPTSRPRPKAKPRATLILVPRAEPEVSERTRYEPSRRVKVSPYIFACPTCDAGVDEPCRDLRVLRAGRLQEVAPHPARRALAAVRRRQ